MTNTFAFVDILIKAIKDTGPDLNRPKLIEAVEKIKDFETGLVPKISFSSSRRSGISGAYLINGSKDFYPLWVTY